MRTGGMKKGYKYSRKRIWITNDVVETLIFEDENIPQGFELGRLPRNWKVWNAGLTKENDERLKKMSNTIVEHRKELPNKYIKYTPEYIQDTFAHNDEFLKYWNTHGFKDCATHFHIGCEALSKIILELGLESPKEHSERIKHLTYTQEWRQEHRNKLKGKNTWSKGCKHSQEQIQKFKESHSKRTSEDIKVSKQKEHSTKLKNNSYLKHKTKEEQDVEKILLKYFDASDIVYQHFDIERYPYDCDFYIKSKDLFIEVNAYPSHNNHPYGTQKDDDETLNLWKEKIEKGFKQYANWIYTWTELDVKKKECAITHDLNYIALYHVNELEKLLDDYM